MKVTITHSFRSRGHTQGELSFLFIGHVSKHMEYQFLDQGLNPGHGSLESEPLSHLRTPRGLHFEKQRNLWRRAYQSWVLSDE